MTSINALRLDFHSGLMLCDEARYWNPEWMIFYTPEKIRRIVSEHIVKKTKTIMFMGQTGTSSIGDEWIMEVGRAITREYEKRVESDCADADCLPRLNDMAHLAFQTIIKVKQTHIDDFLIGKFGFASADLIRGYTLDKEKGKIPITNKDQIKAALNYMTFNQNPDAVKGIFGNSQILAGYNPVDGFKMFYMTERWPVCEEVHEIFIAQGSGRDTCDLNYSRFADTRLLSERRSEKSIPRQKGLYALLQGLYQALNQTAGIGGYPKIIYINGHEKNPAKWTLEISDYRSKLALEIVGAAVESLLDKTKAEDMLEDLIFKGADFFKINARFKAEAVNVQKLERFLRKYPL